MEDSLLTGPAAALAAAGPADRRLALLDAAIADYDGGETSLDNCVLLCAAHHKLIHHTGWEVHAVPRGRPYFTKPGGTRYHGPRIPRAG